MLVFAALVGDGFVEGYEVGSSGGKGGSVGRARTDGDMMLDSDTTG